MKKLKVLLMVTMLSTGMAISTNAYTQDSELKVEEVSKVVEAKATEAKVDAVEVVKKVVLPELDADLGFFEQSVLLVQFAVKNWKSMGGLGISSLILLFLVSLLNSPLTDGWFGKKSKMIKRLVIAVLGQAVGVTAGIYGGAVWYVAIVTGLITSGGAVAVFEAAKPLFAKKE